MPNSVKERCHLTCETTAVRIAEAGHGPDHPEVGRTRNNLGLVLRDLGDPPGARAQFERALQICEPALGSDHPEIGILRTNLRALTDR